MKWSLCSLLHVFVDWMRIIVFALRGYGSRRFNGIAQFVFLANGFHKWRCLCSNKNVCTNLISAPSQPYTSRYISLNIQRYCRCLLDKLTDINLYTKTSIHTEMLSKQCCSPSIKQIKLSERLLTAWTILDWEGSHLMGFTGGNRV